MSEIIDRRQMLKRSATATGAVVGGMAFSTSVIQSLPAHAVGTQGSAPPPPEPNPGQGGLPSIDITSVAISSANKTAGTVQGSFTVANRSGDTPTGVYLGEVKVAFVVVVPRSGKYDPVPGSTSFTPEASGHFIEFRKSAEFTFSCSGLVFDTNVSEISAFVTINGVTSDLGASRDQTWTNSSEPYKL